MRALKLLSFYLLFFALFFSIAQAQQETAIKYENGVQYEGEVVDGQPNGMGTMRFPSGEVFQGRFVDGLLQGTAIITKPDGASFIGDYNNHTLIGDLRPLRTPIQAAQNQRSLADCLDAYEADYRLGEMILRTYELYGSQIRSVSTQGFSAYTKAASTNTDVSIAMARGNEAARPYTERANQLSAERNYKVDILQYQRGVLKSENPHCKLL